MISYTNSKVANDNIALAVSDRFIISFRPVTQSEPKKNVIFDINQPVIYFNIIYQIKRW